jgi:probable rRNA maturation factor
MSRTPKLTLNLQFPAAKVWPEHKAILPRATVASWIKAALFADAELTVRLVDAEEGRTLNRTYRGKDYSTNVLTFAYAESEDDPVTGDLILCCPVVEKEARAGVRSRGRRRSAGNGSHRNRDPRQTWLPRPLSRTA